jgi:hypothetical protein
MNIKSIYTNLDKIVSLPNKLLNTNTYYKQLIRFKKDTNTLLIDDDLNQLFIKTTNVQEEGQFVTYKTLKAQHSRYKQLKFTITTPNKNLISSTKLTDVINKLNEKKTFNVQINKRVKGGFIGYSNGFVGFIPNNHVIITAKDVSQRINKQQKNLLAVHNPKVTNLFNLKRLKFEVLKISITPNQWSQSLFQKTKSINKQKKFFFNYIFLKRNLIKQEKIRRTPTIYEFNKNKEKTKFNKNKKRFFNTHGIDKKW